MFSYKNRVVRFLTMILLMGVLGWALAACGGDASTATPAATAQATTAAQGPTDAPGATAGSTSAQEVAVTLQEFSITPANISVKAGKVRFVVTNKGTLSHNFTIMGDSGPLAATTTFPASESPQTIEIDLKPGTYQTLCTVPGHAQHGQRGTITVQ